MATICASRQTAISWSAKTNTPTIVDNHIRGITPDGRPYDFARLTMQTELAGGCFSPDGKWFFVNAYAPTRTLAITGRWESVT